MACSHEGERSAEPRSRGDACVSSDNGIDASPTEHRAGSVTRFGVRPAGSGRNRIRVHRAAAVGWTAERPVAGDRSARHLAGKDASLAKRLSESDGRTMRPIELQLVDPPTSRTSASWSKVGVRAVRSDSGVGSRACSTSCTDICSSLSRRRARDGRVCRPRSTARRPSRANYLAVPRSSRHSRTQLALVSALFRSDGVTGARAGQARFGFPSGFHRRLSQQHVHY